MFSLRIVDTDHYLATPIPQLDVCFADFRQAELKRVPVVRIYGATPQGQKACMHLHGVFPYMYVPSDGSFSSQYHLRQFACSIDKALNVALGNSSATTQHVYKISLVSGIPFYGYHGSETQFLKIYFINPLMVKKAADLLLGGAVMNKVFQPHETHIPYRLQLFIDYNLYGMNMINVAAVKFRQSPKNDNANPSHISQKSDEGSTPGQLHHSLSLGESFLSKSVCTQMWEVENIPSEMWLDTSVERQSTCELEVDVVAADILNRHEVGANVGANPGLVALWEDEQQRRQVKGNVTELKAQESQDRGHVEWSEAEALLQERLQQILQDLAPYIEESDSEASEDVTPSGSQLDLSITPADLQATPSSVLELHLSQSEGQDLNSSQETVILEGDQEDSSPIVNLNTVQRVVSLSQSFRAERGDSHPLKIPSSQDRSLAHILASLADDSPAASQVASQIISSEEQDSILTGISPADDKDDDGESLDEEEETMEMSQVIWEGQGEGHLDDEQVEGQTDEASDKGDENENGEKEQNLSQLSFNLEGMDQSWNSSLWQDVTNQNVPQLDGTSDDKQQDDTVHHEKKRLGTRGAVISRSTKDASIKSNGEKIHPLGELHVLLKQVQKQREAMKSVVEAGRNGENSRLVLDLRSPTPMPVHNVEETSDSEADIVVDDKVTRFTLEPGGSLYARVSASEESDADSVSDGLNASGDLFDEKSVDTTKSHRHGNIFSTLSSELSGSELALSGVSVEISRDIQLPFNRDHLSSDSKDRLLEKYTSISDGSERIIESDSEDHYSVDSFVGFRKTSCIVPRRPSSESSTASTDTELHVGPHTFTYDRTAFLKKERPQFTQILDKNKPFPEILKELETVDDGAEKGSIDIAESIKNKDNVCNDIADGQCSHTSLTQQHEDRPCRSGGEQIASDLSEYEELLPDQDSTSVSENEAGMLDLTGCDDPVDIIEYTSDVPSTEEIPVKKRGRPPGKSPKKASTPKNEILLLHRKTSTRKIKSPWKIREDFVHDLSSWVSSAESSDFQGSPRGESSDSSYIPYISKDAERTVKRNKLSLSKKKRKRSESAVMTCKPIVEDRSHVSRLDVYEGDLIRVIHKGDQLTYKHSVKISDAKNAKKNGPAGVAGKEERVWFSSTAAIGYCDGQKSTNLQALECCVQVRKDEYFKYDFSKICNEKLCLNSVTNELLEKCPPVAMVQSSETKESIDDSSESGAKKTAAIPSIVTDILKDNSRSAVSETVETVVVKNPALLSVKAAEKGSSRRSSADGHVAEKGQVCELDFSFLENTMDTDAEGIQRPETEDPHLQLHTPPLMIDPDQSENMSVPAQDQELVETISASPRDADVQLTTTQTEARTSADGQEAENSMCSFNFAVTGSQSDQNRLSNVELNGIENISRQDSQDKLLNSTSKKVYTELVNKNKTKKRSNSLSDYYSDAVDDWEEAVKRKKSKHIQSDHYKYRFKRRSADCAESAFSLIYQMESSTAAQQDETIAAPQKKHKGKEKQVPGIHYIIVNKFKGYKSMSVVTPKLKITSSVNVNEYLSNVEKYCWKKNEEPTTYEREQRLLDDSNRESNIVKPSRSAQGRKSGQAKAKRKHARSRYERLSQCFVTRKHRRKKSSGTQSAKFMDTLSLLHDITLAKLTDSPAAVSYCDTTDDHKTAYNDVMFNLALFSPPSSDNGNASPPQPLSPSEDVDSVALHAEEKYSVRGRSVSSPASARLTLTEPLYDTPLSSVEANKCQPKSPDNLASISSENISCYHDIQMDARTQGGGVGGSPHQPDSIVHRRDSNSSGSLYAVKEAVVRFTPPVSTTKLFTSLKYPSDILPPDLGPPLCRQVSPRSLHSGSSGSPPSLHSHYDQSPRLVESDSSCSGAESAPDDQVRMEQSYMYLYSDVDNVVSRIPGQLQHAGSLCGSNPSSARNSTRQSFDSDNSVDGALPQTVSPSHSNDYTGSYAGSGRGSHYSGSDSSSPRNKYEVQCEPISDSSDGEEEHVSKHTPSRESSKHSKKIRKPPAIVSPASAVSTGLSHSPRMKSPPLAPVEQEQEQHHSSFQESLFEDNLFTTQSPPSLSNPGTQQTTASHAETSPQTQTSSINNSSPTLPEYCMQQSPLPQSTSVDSSQHSHSQGNVHTSIVSPYTQPSGQSLYSRHSGQSSESSIHSVQSPPPHYPHRASSQPQHSSCDNLSIVIQHNIDNSSPGSECHNSAVTVATDIDNCSTESPLSSLQRDPRYLHHQSLEASAQMPCGSMQQSPPQQSGSLKSPAAGSFMQQSPPQQSPSHRSPAVGNFMQQSPAQQSLSHRYPATAPSSFMQQSSNHSSPATSGSFMQQSSSQQSPSHRSPAAPPSFMQPSPSCGDSSTVIQQSPNLPSPRHYDNSVKQSSIQHSPLSGYSIQQSPVRVPQPSPVQSSPSHCTSMQQSPLQVSSVHPSPSHSSSIQQSPVESVSFQQSPSAQNNASVQQQSVHDNASTQQSPYNSNAMQQQSPYNPTMQQSPYNNATMQQHSPHNNATIQQHSPHNATIQQHSPHNNMTMPQHSPHNATIQQHSPHNNMTMPQHSPHNNATIQQHSPHNNVTVQQHSPHNNATIQQHSPHNNMTMQQHSSHNNVTMQQHSPHNTMQQHSPHNSATMQQQSLHNNATIQQQSSLQCGSLQLSPHATAVPPAGQMQHSPAQTFHSAHSPGYNVPPPLPQPPQTQLHYSQNVPLSSAQMLTQHSPVQSVPPSRLFREKHRQSVKNKKLNSQGYVGSDILSPVSDHSQNSPRGQYSSMLHCQDFPAKDQQNFDSGPRRLDERTSLLNDIRQFDASHHSHGDEQLTENCYMPPHPMASMFDLNRHSDNNMGMIPPSYSNYPHRHASNPGGASFTSMPPMYHSPPTLHQNQHNFATQYPTNGGSQGEPSHHSLGPTSHHSQYSPHSCSGYEHGWNSHPGMYPTSAFRHTSCGREEPPGWYPHSGRDPLTVITPMLPPPTKSHLLSGILGYGLSEVQHRDPFCSNHGDLPDRPRVVGGRVLKVESHLVTDLPEFDSSLLQNEGLHNWQTILATNRSSEKSQDPDSSFNIIQEIQKNPQLKAVAMGDREAVITPCKLPPSRDSILRWLKERQTQLAEKDKLNERAQNLKPEKSKVQKANAPVRDDDNSKNFQLKEPSENENQDTVSAAAASGNAELEKTVDKEFETPKSLKILHMNTKTLDRLDTETMKRDRISIAVTPATPKSHFTSQVIRQSSQGFDDDVNPIHSTPVQRNPSVTGTELVCTPILSTQTKNTKSDEIIKIRADDEVTPIFRKKTVEIIHTDATPSTSKGISSARRCLNTAQPTPGVATSSAKTTPITNQQNRLLATPHELKSFRSQIEGPTPNNTYGFRISQDNLQDVKAVHEVQYLTVLSLELHMKTRGDLRPDPEFDPIEALFYSIHNDVPAGGDKKDVTGVLIVDADSMTNGEQNPSGSVAHQRPLLEKSGITNLKVTYFRTEEEMLKEFINLVRSWDPDILVGYEIQMLSWGYLLERGAQLSVDMCSALSRIPENNKDSRFHQEKDEYASEHMSDIIISGRIVLNLWRILRHEVTLNVYSFENVAFHVLHQRIPLYPFRSLTRWFEHRTHVLRWRTVEHYAIRARGNLQIMEQIDLIGQTSEFARVFGIEFYHVLSRGSQYRVESMMLRLAKPMNYIPVSPSVQQRARMMAPECIPLTMEPESRFYSHPVVVLDFQSLYPSIMIAYNYCYSTCLGRLDCLKDAQDGPFEFGCCSLNITPKQLMKLKDKVNICPNGVVFLNREVRKGVIAGMVEEILNTRIMVKQSMKLHKNDKALSKLLHARQLGLKLIANVTFGYTSANFSGRMPCVEIGDSIVRKARETLERAINLVHSTPKWGAKVVYGDTDSMFILMKGRTKDEAFRIGQEIADAVTASNPKPIKLKFEKVYLPCILQTKKRYCGFMYETPDQKEPQFDAKGIETVRRDACPAVAKILERSIKLLFTSRDISQVKSYVQRQCMKIMEGKVGMQDLIFAKEYRGARGYQPTACVPALEIAKRVRAVDRRAEPRVGERVPYVIVYGMPGLPLIQLVKQPIELLHDASLRINANYYISKQIIPPLERAFSLIGIDVKTWYSDLPRVTRATPASHFNTDAKKSMISQYFSTVNCAVCDELTNQGVCVNCQKDPQLTCVVLNDRIRRWERAHQQLSQICRSCMGTQDAELPCVSLDCPVVFRLSRAGRELSQEASLRLIQQKLLSF